MRATAIVTGVVLLAMAGCGVGGDDASGADVGELKADLKLAPSEARCVVFSFVRNGPATTRAFDVAPDSSTAFNLQGLPLGTSTVTVTAFSVSCEQRNGVAPTWRSNAVDVTFSGAGPVSAMFVMVDLREMGQLVASVDFPAQRHGVVTEFSLPMNDPADGITAGPDGNLWLVQRSLSNVVRMTTEGVATSFPGDLDTLSLDPNSIAAGPDGNLWFTTQEGMLGAPAQAVRITTDGVVTGAFTVSSASTDPLLIAAGPDGNMWAALFFGDQLARVTVQGVVTTFPLSPGAGASGVAGGVDGNIWFTERLANKIGRITPAGAVTEFALPTAASGPDQIVTGPDGNLWFTESSRPVLGRISLTGVITEFAVTGFPLGVASGPDGNIWVTERESTVARITPAGAATEFTVTPNSRPEHITVGPDGNIWFTELKSGKVGRITP